jgi:PAS domain S-box-containing protein
MKESADQNHKEKSEKGESELSINEMLIASEIRYRRLFETVQDGILILDAETGMILDVNPFLIDLLGYSKDDFIDMELWEIGFFKDIAASKEKFKELQRKESVRYENLPLETFDGRKISVEFISNVYFVNSKKFIQCNIRDISNRKGIEVIQEATRKELEENKVIDDELSLFAQNIIDTVREPMLLLNAELRVVKASRPFYDFFRVKPDDTLGKLIYELGDHQWDIPKLRALLEKILPEKKTFDDYEVELDFPGIGKRTMLLNARKIKRKSGLEKIILLAFEDITERKFTEELFAEKERLTNEYLDILFNSSQIPILIWDSSLVIIRVNQAFKDLTGYGWEDTENKKIDFLFPKGKTDSSLKFIKDMLASKKTEIIEVDILTKYNEIKTVLWNSANVFDNEGKVIIATVAQDITKRKKSEDALTILETRYRRLFESALDGILIIDAETGRIIDVNPFLVDLLGYPKESFIDCELWELGFFRDIAANKEKFLELQQKEYVRYDNLPLETFDGRKISVEFVSNVYLCNNIKVIQCNIRDITEQTKAQSEIKFQAHLINNVGQAIIATDLLGNVTYWNNAAEKIYGWSPAEAIGQNIINLTPAQQSKEQANDIMKILSEGKTWVGEFYVERKDGRSFPAFVTDTPILDSNGKLAGIIGISSDITERKQLEFDLIAAKEKAEENDRLKTAFLANMSHEIRTPMNGILGFTDLLKSPKLSGEEQQEYVSIIEKSGDRLLTIINNIINISKIESGHVEPIISETNVNEQVEFTYNFLKPLAEEKDLHFFFKNSLPNNEVIILTDKEKIITILTNLVNNSIKFTPAGFIEFGYKKEGNFLEFYVKDTGVGISREQKEIIFERFRQGSESLSRDYEGAGLGLSICKAYVEMLGGEIWVDVNLGNTLPNWTAEKRGSTFHFTIPYKPVPNVELTDETNYINIPVENKIGKLKILIAEDDEISKELIAIVTKDFSREIVIVDNGYQAVEACKNNPDFDLVLMDIKMPIMDGFEATRQIREFNKDLIIIAQTAYAFPDDREKAFGSGCNDYITKPIMKEGLINILNTYFKN